MLESVTNLLEGNNWDTSDFLPSAAKWLEYLLFLIDLKFIDAAKLIKAIFTCRLLKDNQDFNTQFEEKVLIITLKYN